MRRLAPLVLLPMLAVGCAHRPIARPDPELPPSLPSPRADVYTRAPGTPSDPLVAMVSDGLPWDEALSGVATGIALAELAGDRVDGCRLRWLAVQAAYPYPVRGWLADTVAKGAVPERLVAQARAHARDAVDIGLVRARTSDGDRWVLVVADRAGEVPPIPREVELGAEIPLGGAAWTVSDPLGELRAVGAGFVADAPGEWLLAARDGDRVVAAFPLYVGASPPEAPPYACEPAPGEPLSRAAAVVADLRAAYAFPALARDPALDSVARARLRAWREAGASPPAREQLRAAGYIGVPVAAGACRAATVEACIEAMWWSPEDRGALVGDLADYGLAVDAAPGEVRMVLLGAG